MDVESLKKSIAVLKAKAQGARKEGKREIAAAFSHGARRAQRRLKGLLARMEANKPKKEEASAS